MKGKLTALLVIVAVLLFGGSALAQQDFNPVGKEAAVKSVVAKYGLNSSKNKFKGGDNAFILLEVVYHKAKVELTEEEVNKVLDSETYKWDQKVQDTLRIPAFQENEPDKQMCYQQFKRMHSRLLKARTVVIDWLRPGDNYTPVMRVKWDSSDTLRVLPGRLTIVKTRKTVPGK